jgi:hypothetical protein
MVKLVLLPRDTKGNIVVSSPVRTCTMMTTMTRLLYQGRASPLTMTTTRFSEPRASGYCNVCHGPYNPQARPATLWHSTFDIQAFKSRPTPVLDLCVIILLVVDGVLPCVDVHLIFVSKRN